MEKLWIGIGVTGQLLFFARFLVQWIASERAKRSVVPLAFWYFSVLGGSVLLLYAIYRKDPVFIMGQAGGLGHLFPKSVPHSSGTGAIWGSFPIVELTQSSFPGWEPSSRGGRGPVYAKMTVLKTTSKHPSPGREGLGEGAGCKRL